jgi:hypothetical protein
MPHAGDGIRQLSACTGSIQVVLFPDVALTHRQAHAFCQDRLGSSAGLATAAPAVMAAAQALVQQARVSLQQPGSGGLAWVDEHHRVAWASSSWTSSS